MITDLGHAAFGVHDLAASLAFYAKLGLEESFRLHHPDGSLMLVYLHVAGNRFLELFPNGPEPDPTRVQSFRHVCLLTDDLRGTVAALRGQGVAIEREPKEGLDGNLQAWIRDPDGNAIELMQLSGASPQRRVARSARRNTEPAIPGGRGDEPGPRGRSVPVASRSRPHPRFGGDEAPRPPIVSAPSSARTGSRRGGEDVRRAGASKERGA